MFMDGQTYARLINISQTFRLGDNENNPAAFGAKMTSYQRRCASTLIRRHFYVMCPLGNNLSSLKFKNSYVEFISYALVNCTYFQHIRSNIFGIYLKKSKYRLSINGDAKS